MSGISLSLRADPNEPRRQFLNIHSASEKDTLRLVAIPCAAITVLATFVTCTWFFRMGGLFRHRLILLLVLGDFIRAVGYMVNAAVALAEGRLYSLSLSCQASGFLIQLGTEISDFTVAAIAIHTALQVLRPTYNLTGPNGLSRYPHQVFGVLTLLPIFMAALPFVNPDIPGGGYVAESAFCMLPTFPVWYKLALGWVPRYVIAGMILGLAVYLNIYLAARSRKIVKMTTDLPDAGLRSLGSSCPRPKKRPYLAHRQQRKRPKFRDGNSFVSDMSRANSSQAASPAGSPLPSPALVSNSVGIPTAGRASETSSTDDERCSADTTSTHLARTNRLMLLRLRMQFIYPIVYLILWTIPFSLQCLLFTHSYGTSPSMTFSIIDVLCRNILGAVDCLIFGLREQPCLRIPGTSGTFLGSIGLGWLDTARGKRKGKERRARIRPPILPQHSSTTDVHDHEPTPAPAEPRLPQPTLARWTARAAPSAPPTSTAVPPHRHTSPAARFRFLLRSRCDTKEFARSRAYERLAAERAERLAASSPAAALASLTGMDPAPTPEPPRSDDADSEDEDEQRERDVWSALAELRPPGSERSGAG